MLEALADPNHERHGEMCNWLGGDFDPNAPIDTSAIDINLLDLAKRWARRPRKKPQPQSELAAAFGRCILSNSTSSRSTMPPHATAPTQPHSAAIRAPPEGLLKKTLVHRDLT